MIGMTCSRQQHPSTSSLCQTLPTPDWYLESKPRRLLGKKKNLVPAKRKRSKLSYLNGRRVSLDDSGRALVLQLASDEGMPINPIAGLEGEKRADAQDHGAEHFIADVEVVVGIGRPVPFEDAVVGIVGRVLGQAGMESGARFHGFENEVDAEALPTFHGAKIRSDVIFLAEAFLLHVFIGPAEGNTVVTREGFDPMLVVSRSLPQRLFSNGIDAVHVAEEMDDMLRTSEQGEIALDDDAIKTVVYKSEQAGKQLAEGFHRSSFPAYLP